MKKICFYVNKGNVVFRSLFVVVRVHHETVHVHILFQTANLGQIMFSGNNTENGHICDSRKSKQIVLRIAGCCKKGKMSIHPSTQ